MSVAGRLPCSEFSAGVAQLAEQPSCKRQVAGSTPVTGSSGSWSEVTLVRRHVADVTGEPVRYRPAQVDPPPRTVGEGPFHLVTPHGTGGRQGRPPFLISSRMIAVVPRMTASIISRTMRRSILVLRRTGSGSPLGLVLSTESLPVTPGLWGPNRTDVRYLPSSCPGLAADGSLRPRLGRRVALRAITEPLQTVSPASRYCADARASVRANRDIGSREKASFCLLVTSQARLAPAPRAAVRKSRPRGDGSARSVLAGDRMGRVAAGTGWAASADTGWVSAGTGSAASAGTGWAASADTGWVSAGTGSAASAGTGWAASAGTGWAASAGTGWAASAGTGWAASARGRGTGPGPGASQGPSGGKRPSCHKNAGRAGAVTLPQQRISQCGVACSPTGAGVCRRPGLITESDSRLRRTILSQVGNYWTVKLSARLSRCAE
jgi:hypothetical protein